MAALGERTYSPIHPLHAILLAGMLPLFLGTLLSDLAYASTNEIQWKNFSSWLIVGGLVFAVLALVCSIAGLFRRHRRGRAIIYFLVLLATLALGVLNALFHAMDAWAGMPQALVLSPIVAALAIGATALGFSTLRAGVLR